MSFDELLSREEILIGLPAKRANTLLFLIEKKVAQIVTNNKITFALNDSGNLAHEQVFLQAFASVNQISVHPTIQQLERYACEWACLVPEMPKIKAALIHALAQKYQFSQKSIPNISQVLDLHNNAVKTAYSRLYRTPIEKIYKHKLSLLENLHWTFSYYAQKIESLPPFWLATFITIALGLPQAFLALPIAVAEMGPLTAITFLILIGIIHIITITCMAESIGRSGDFHSGKGFIKQLANNYLGKAGASILSIAVGIRVFLIALACYIGLATTMSNIIPIPPYLWAVLLFIGGIYILLQKSPNFTVAVMVILALINISLLLLIASSTLVHLQWQNLLYINLPFGGEKGLSSGTLQPLIGVSLMLYFGHVYVADCSKIILPRDPSASSLIQGSIVGTAFLTGLFCFWVLAVNGAISPEILAGYSGTVLNLIAQQINPTIHIWGSVLAILLLGMAWMRSSSLLLNLANEWLPKPILPILTLSSHQGTLIFSSHPNLSKQLYLGITYLRLQEKQPLFLIEIQQDGHLYHLEKIISQDWSLQEFIKEIPQLRTIYLNKSEIKITIQSANSRQVSLQVQTSMLMSYTGTLKTEYLQKHPSLSNRQNASFISKRWQQTWKIFQQNKDFLLSISPLVLVFLTVEGLFLAQVQSFTTVLGFAGVLGNSLVGGIFPILLLISSRSKGERVPSVALSILNYKLLRIGLYGLFILILLVHGLFIWENFVARFCAISLAIFSLVATIMMEHQGAFAPRVIIELEKNQKIEDSSLLRITARGCPKSAEICLGYPDKEESYQASSLEISSFSSLQYIRLNLLTETEKEIRILTHETPLNDSPLKLPNLLEINSNNQVKQFDLKLSKGQILLPISSQDRSLKLTLRDGALA